MHRWARIASVVGVVVLVALVAALLTAGWAVRRSFPQTEGRLVAPGLIGEVEVLRDAYGVPQIYADSAHDLFFAQGFVQAQDRFFEMDFRRHVTAGRLSELFGESTLEADMFVRTLGWREVAEREVARLDMETRSYLVAFSAGVNAYLEDRSAAELSLEYAVLALRGLDYAPEPWSPADSLAWLKAMAWDLRGDMQDEIDRVLATESVSRRQVAQLYPPYPYRRHDPIVTTGAVVDGVFEPHATHNDSRRPTRAPLSPQVLAAFRRLDRVTDTLPTLLGTGHGLGSNSWVVAGDRTNTGKPLLANDPHLGPTMPGVWYPMGLHCRDVGPGCPFDVSGYTFAGVPGVVIGHNDRIAWGFTNLGPDVADLYLEDVAGDTYRYAGRWRPLHTHEETIDVAGGVDRTFTVRATRHGPLVSDVDERIARVGAVRTPGQHSRSRSYAVALRWTALTPGTTADALFALDAAGSWEEFRAAARDFEVPAQNLVYADVDGHIGYQAPGRIPIRRTGTGDWPVPGWNPAYEWADDVVPFDALPHVVDPEIGYIVTANQAVAAPSYPYYLGSSWSYGYRSDRIATLIESDRSLSVDDMTRMQLDTRNGNAAVLVPYLEDVDVAEGYVRAGQRLLAGWAFDQPADSAAAAYFNVVWANLLALTFHDQLPEEVWPDGDDRWFEVVRSLLSDPDNAWWDDVDTKGVRETRDDILMAAMTDARYEMTRRQARSPALWSWGHLHRLELVHQSLGESGIAPVEWLFNRGPYQLGGGESVVNATGWSADRGYQVDWAPSMRMVVSLDDMDDSRWINLTGVSGHAFHRHYDDQTELWARGETLPWPSSRAAVEQAATDRLVLAPR
ncbi:MAG: penicillin acylase family protein [Actinomycetota bacterium]|nr:penicillin acylase family protein [Actinomycetota bacterium]